MKVLSHALLFNFIAGCLLVANSGLVSGAQQLITAVFSPDANNPSHNKFVNTTPVTGFCLEFPHQCNEGMFSTKFAVKFESNQDLDPVEAAANARKAAYFMVPSAFRTVDVTNDTTGAIFSLKFRISGFGGRYVLRDGSWHGHLWSNGMWTYAPAPCINSGMGQGDKFKFDFFWKYPESATTACVKTPGVVISAPFQYTNMTLGYEWVTPDPLAMDIGTYSGSATYSVGPGGDFDFGDVMVGTDNQITFDFKLAVNHVLKVDFPAGADRAILQPHGGWRQWMNSGRNPPMLTAEQTFKISSSGKFKVYLECQYPVGHACSIRGYANDDYASTAVETMISLPVGIVNESTNQPVNFEFLRVGENNAVHFKTVSPQFSREAKMHYRIMPSSVEKMIEIPGTTFRGGTTIVFDADI